MREIVLDTETTGLSPAHGHRLVEIGCVELFNHLPTGRVYHQYLNPERGMPAEAFAVHGLSEEFLRDFPLFSDVADTFIEFLGDAPLVIHNASFDMAFINAELQASGRPVIPMTRAIDTIPMARRKFPGAQAGLDALCRRFGIDNSNRELHGALLDAGLLAEVYLELIGGRQPGLELATAKGASPDRIAVKEGGNARPPRPHAPTAAEEAAHAAFLAKIKEPLWLG